LRLRRNRGRRKSQGNREREDWLDHAMRLLPTPRPRQPARISRRTQCRKLQRHCVAYRTYSHSVQADAVPVSGTVMMA
jgi:type VI protein secretion system component VasF